MKKVFNIFPIQGINSNINYDGITYHIQTEVLTGKLIVLTQIFLYGNIIHTEFLSFKKYYNSLIADDPIKLKRGIEQLVHILHEKGLKWLKDYKEKDLYHFKNLNCGQQLSEICEDRDKSVLYNWLKSTIENFSSDYPEITMDGFICHCFEKQYFSIHQNSNMVLSGSELEILLRSINILINDLSPKVINEGILDILFFEIKGYKIFVYMFQSDELVVIISDQKAPTGLLKMELERYLEVLKNVIKK